MQIHQRRGAVVKGWQAGKQSHTHIHIHKQLSLARSRIWRRALVCNANVSMAREHKQLPLAVPWRPLEDCEMMSPGPWMRLRGGACARKGSNVLATPHIAAASARTALCFTSRRNVPRHHPNHAKIIIRPDPQKLCSGINRIPIYL